MFRRLMVNAKTYLICQGSMKYDEFYLHKFVAAKNLFILNLLKNSEVNYI